MKRWKRVLAAFLSFLMVATILPALDIMDSPLKTANAAAPAAYFSADDFGLCYTKILLQQVGKAYGNAGDSSSGYTVGGKYYYDAASRVTAGTPYNPQTINSNTFDCHGLVITCLMAMGYDKFTDTKGHEYPLNAAYGGSIFDGQNANSMFRYNGTGDTIILHHSNDQTYTLKFKLGKVTNKSDLQEVSPGTLLFNLAKGATIPEGGQFSAGWMPTITHSAVALFYLKRADNIDGKRINDGIYSTADINAALTASYDNAYAALKKICTDADANPNKNLTGFTTVFNSVFATPTYSHNGHIVPKLWDARSRGFWGREATASNYKVGFTDGHASVGFGTPYDSIWQIESIGNGVCINNNPYGKTADVQIGVYMEPTHESGTVKITKKDDKTGAVLTGASFDLYEWSASKGQFIKSSLYHIAEDGNSGIYKVYDSNNQEALIEFTAENCKTIKVVETKAPDGYQGNWSEEHTFTGDGEVKPWEVTAFNPGIKIGVAAHKTGYNNTNLSGAKFTLYSNEACTTTAADANGVSVFTSGTNGNTGALTFTLCSNAQTYYLKETTIPTGYLSDGAIYRLTIAKASTGTIQIDKKIGTGSWTAVQTISAANAKALSAAFNVNNKVQSAELTVTKGNMLALTGATRPSGWAAGATTVTTAGAYTFTTTTAVTGTVSANSPLYGKTVTVEIRADGAITAGGETIYADNALVATKTFKTNESVTVTDLPYGKYKVVETSAPEGWALNSSVKSVTLDSAAGGKVQIDDQKWQITFKATKKGPNGENLSGGLFGLYCTSDIYNWTGSTVLIPKDTVIVAVAANNGVIDFGETTKYLPAGLTYYVKEIKAPTGYIPQSEKLFGGNFTYTDASLGSKSTNANANKTLGQTVNQPKTTLNVKKLAKASGSGFTVDTKALDAAFVVYYPDTSTFTTFHTNPNGTTPNGYELKFGDYVGTLYMFEMVAPTGYRKDNGTMYEIVVDNTGASKVTLCTPGGSDVRFWGNGYTRKTSTTITAASHTYNVYNVPVGSLSVYKKYDTLLVSASKNGFENSGSNMAVGKYTVNTTSLSLFDGYSNANSPFYQKKASFKITAGETITNENGETIYASGAPIANQKYELLDKNGKVVDNTKTTDANGVFEIPAGQRAVISGLPYGKYTVTETAAPNGIGYTVASPKTIVVQANPSNVEIEETKDTMNVSILKRNKDTLAPISGGLFGIYCTTDIYDYTGSNIVLPANTVFQIVTAGTDGKANFDSELIRSLPAGKEFKVCELKAPDGYMRSTKDQSFTYVPKDSKSLTFDNTQAIDVTFTKTLTSLLSAKSGSWDGKTVGHYTYDVVTKDVFEVGANSPFKGQTVTFNITAADVVKDSDGNQIYAKGAAVANTACQIVDAKGTATNATTDANGNITFPVGSKVVMKGLPYGKYEAKETAAPQAYTLNGTPIAVDGTTRTGTVTDTKKTYSAVITKTDGIKNTPVSGGLFGLYCTTDIYDYTGATLLAEKNTVLAIQTAGTDGTIDFSDVIVLLPYGMEYYIVELEAPANYRLNDKKLTFTYQTNTATGSYAATLPNLPLGSLSVVKTGDVPKYTFTDKLLTGVTFDAQPLAGAVYEVYVGEKDIVFDGAVATYTYQGKTITLNKNTLVATLKTDNHGEAVLSALPVGEYVVKEKAAPNENYLVNVESKKTSVSAAGFAASVPENDDLTRLYLNVVKEGPGKEPIEHALIGVFTKEALWNEPANSNRYTKEIDGVTYALLMVRETDANGVADFTDIYIPYSEMNKLVVMEIEAPVGYLLNENVFPVSTTIVNRKAEASITIVDALTEMLGTKASSDGNLILQQGIVNEDAPVTIYDEVYFELNPSSYIWRMVIDGYNEPQSGRELRIVGKLVDKETGEFLKDSTGAEITGEVVVDSSKVVNAQYDGKDCFSVKVAFENMDTTPLVGKTIVMYEYIYLDKELVNKEELLENNAETLFFPSIGTTFVNKGALAGETGLTGSNVVFEDTVKLTNLLVGQDYRLETKVFDKTANAFIKVDGKETLASLTFTANKENDTRAIIVAINSLGLEDHLLVCYEYLYAVTGENSETLVIAEKNPNNVNQTQSITGMELPSTGRMELPLYVLFGFLMILLGAILVFIGYKKKENCYEAK